MVYPIHSFIYHQPSTPSNTSNDVHKSATLCGWSGERNSCDTHSFWQRSIILTRCINEVQTDKQRRDWLVNCFLLSPGALKCRTDSRKDFLENEERPNKVSKPGQVNKLSQLPGRNWLALDKLTKALKKQDFFKWQRLIFWLQSSINAELG